MGCGAEKRGDRYRFSKILLVNNRFHYFNMSKLQWLILRQRYLPIHPIWTLEENTMNAIRMAAYVAVCTMIMASVATAEIPSMINFQGRLTRDDGSPLDTTVTIWFYIYDAETGGSLKWTETHPGVTVTNGLFNIMLGSINQLPNGIFGGPDRWLAIQLDGQSEGDPRTRLTSVGYAYHSSRSDTAEVAFQVLGESAAGWTDDGSQVRLTIGGDSVGIGTSTPESKLHVFTPGSEAKFGESNRAIYGEHFISGSYGFLAGLNVGASGYGSLYGVQGGTFDGYAVYGGTSGPDGHGVYGESINGHYGFLGGPGVGAFGMHHEGSFGYLGGSFIGVHGSSASGYAGHFSGKLYTSGYAGFGVDPPETKLHVSGGNWDLSANEGDFKIGSSSYRIKMGIATAGGGSGDARIRAQGGTNRLMLGTGTNDVLTMYGTNVGVGTTFPGSRLDVNGVTRVGADAWPTSGQGMELAYSAALKRGYIQVYDRDASAWGKLYLGNGNVGIGVEDPQEKLQLKGNLRLDNGPGGGNFIRFVEGGTFKWSLLHRPWATTTFQIWDEEGGRAALSFEEGTSYVGVHTTTPSTELDVNGTLRVTGAFVGNKGPNNGAPFPRPAYDSGWLTITAGQTLVRTHNIGVDVNKYFVDLQFQESGGLGINQRGIGGDARRPFDGLTYRGAYWHNLTTTTVSITRWPDDLNVDQVRVRIWFIE